MRKYDRHTNKIRTAVVFLIFFLAVTALSISASSKPFSLSADVSDPVYCFHTHEELIDMFKTLCDAHPQYTSYEVIGKTLEERDIWIFKIGNPNGGRVMWDGCLHGWEDMGSEVTYLMTKWLLESGDETASRILERNYILFVPVVNMDSYERQNRNFEVCPWGVDLNRNFHRGWRSKEVNDYDYPGPYAGSEPETQVMRNAFQTYHPDFYVNTHYGGGPALGYFRRSNETLVNQVIDRINEISIENGVEPYPGFGHRDSNGFEHPPSSLGSGGLAIGDAYSFGACAWLFEVAGGSGGVCYRHTEHSYDDIVNTYYPRSLPIFITMCEACQVEPIGTNTTITTFAYNDKYVFTVESNSTISNLAFNTTDWTLSFTATGSNGTRGYAKVTFAKTLVANTSNIKVYLDGTQTEYSITSLNDSWILTFTYIHSTHQAAVNLSSDMIPEFPSYITLLLFILASLIAAIAYKRHARIANYSMKNWKK